MAAAGADASDLGHVPTNAQVERMPVEAYSALSGLAPKADGKAAIVGLNGEIEHASGLIHTLRFGNKFREAVGGKSYLSFTNKRGVAGSSIQIPMMHKIDEGFRSHYLTLEFAVPDAPGPDEILVAIGAATTGRAFPRIGDRYMDKEEMAAEKKA